MDREVLALFYSSRNTQKEDFLMRRVLLVVMALAALIGFAPQASAQSGSNYIRVMHASPDAPNVDIYVDGSRVLADVPFFALSGQLALPDGTYNVAIVPAGGSLSDAVFEGPLSLSGGYTGTVAALGSLSMGNFQVVLYDDDFSPVPAGMARVNVIHASPDAPAVDIKLAGTDTVVASNLSFTDAGTVEVPAGTYSFDITPAGSSTVVFTTPPLRFESGWSYTLAATGFLSSNFWVQSRVDFIGQ